jgi:hypothetical protein
MIRARERRKKEIMTASTIALVVVSCVSILVALGILIYQRAASKKEKRR